MRKLLIVGLAIAAIFASTLPLAAQGSSSLGVFGGLAVPGRDTTHLQGDGKASFNWGFFVNLPLLQTFNIVPSAELYKFDAANATDFDLAFKFIVPLPRFSVFAGVSPGLTSVGETTDMHIAGLAGASVKLVSNVDAFFQAKYAYILDSDKNTGVTHLQAGVLFNF